MDPATISAIQKALAPVADKIGQGAQYGWQVVMTQQYVTAIGDFIFAGVCLLVFLAGIGFAITAIKYKQKNDYDDSKIPLACVAIILIGLGLVLGPLALYDGIAHLINPAYYALQFFINLVHPAN